jgi:hypothetical protein
VCVWGGGAESVCMCVRVCAHDCGFAGVQNGRGTCSHTGSLLLLLLLLLVPLLLLLFTRTCARAAISD